jgi:hypothetical protein
MGIEIHTSQAAWIAVDSEIFTKWAGSAHWDGGLLRTERGDRAYVVAQTEKRQRDRLLRAVSAG